jgi:hypothetical protein
MTGEILMSEFTSSKSDRLNAEDLLGGPLRVTITGVERLNRDDGKVALHYDGENGKPFMPCLSMRRVLARIWGDRASEYVGREMVLFRNPEVVFGKAKTGGVRISHMSGIDAVTSVVIPIAKGRAGEYNVAPLPSRKAEPADATPSETLTLCLGNIAAVKSLAGLGDIRKRDTPVYKTLEAHEQREIRAALAAREVELAPEPVDDATCDDWDRGNVMAEG